MCRVCHISSVSEGGWFWSSTRWSATDVAQEAGRWRAEMRHVTRWSRPMTICWRGCGARTVSPMRPYGRSSGPKAAGSLGGIYRGTAESSSGIRTPAPEPTVKYTRSSLSGVWQEHFAGRLVRPQRGRMAIAMTWRVSEIQMPVGRGVLLYRGADLMAVLSFLDNPEFEGGWFLEAGFHSLLSGCHRCFHSIPEAQGWLDVRCGS